jgi:hypothetical protein
MFGRGVFLLAHGERETELIAQPVLAEIQPKDHGAHLHLRTSLPVAASQTLHVPSVLLDATNPVLENATARTKWRCPTSGQAAIVSPSLQVQPWSPTSCPKMHVCNVRPGISQTRILLSWLPDTIDCPHGDQQQASTPPSCSPNATTCRPEEISQTRTYRSAPPDAIRVQSGENEIDHNEHA